MALTAPGIRSLETPRSPQLPKPRPIESMRGPKSAAGRRSSGLRFRDSLSGGLQVPGRNDDMQWPVMHVFRRQDGKTFHFWGTELSANHVDRCGRIGISCTLRQRAGRTFPLRHKISGPNSGEKLYEQGIMSRWASRHALPRRPRLGLVRQRCDGDNFDNDVGLCKRCNSDHLRGRRIAVAAMLRAMPAKNSSITSRRYWESSERRHRGTAPFRPAAARVTA